MANPAAPSQRALRERALPPSARPGPAGRATRCAVVATLALLVSSCAWLPNEFNLSPFYRQRMDQDGTLLELDVLWPIVHYERTPEGGDDFRIRPFYRRVTEPDAAPKPFVTPADGFIDSGLAAVEHQFLWPAGRVRTDAEQQTQRLWPLWSYTSRLDDLGLRETDWYALFPFFWGGSREDGAENYFGFFPFYADFPDFLTYERLHAVLFPLYLGLEKQGRSTHMFMWPFAGYSSGPEGYWHRVLPFYSYENTLEALRTSIAWPFIHWGVERRNTADPISRFFLWPLIGRQWSDGDADGDGAVSAWSFLWPFFQWIDIAGRSRKIDAFWPIFRYEYDTSETSPLHRWWIFPFIARTIAGGDQWAWNFLWPLIWLREYADPDGSTQTQRWFLPLYWSIDRRNADGSEDQFDQVWPLWHREANRDGRGDWSVPSVWPYRAGNAYGFAEAYDWLWTLAKGTQRSADDHAIDTAFNIYSARTRGETTQASVPFLFNYEGDAEGGTLRLFQFIPIPWSGTAPAEPQPATTSTPTATTQESPQ